MMKKKMNKYLKNIKKIIIIIYYYIMTCNEIDLKVKIGEINKKKIIILRVID